MEVRTDSNRFEQSVLQHPAGVRHVNSKRLLLAFNLNLQLSIVQILDLTNQIAVCACIVHERSFLEVGDLSGIQWPCLVSTCLN